MPKDFLIHSSLNVLFQVDRKQSPLFPTFAEQVGEGRRVTTCLLLPALDINYDKCKTTAQPPTHFNLLQPRHLPAGQQ